MDFNKYFNRAPKTPTPSQVEEEPTEADFANAGKELKAMQESKRYRLSQFFRKSVITAGFLFAFVSGYAKGPGTPEAPVDDKQDPKKKISVTGAEQITSSTMHDYNPNTDYLEGGGPDPEKVGIDFSGSFEVDKADLSPEAIENARTQMKAILSSISPENAEHIKAWVLRSSCDERPTNAWEDGNGGLANARLDVLMSILQDEVAKFDFSSKLTDAQSEALKKLPFTRAIADFPGAEHGVTPSHEVINPDTGKAFTAEELKDPETLERARDLARYVKFSAENLDTKDQMENLLKNANTHYSKVTFLMDVSGSMQRDYGADMDHAFRSIESSLEGEKINFGTFSDKLHTLDDMTPHQVLDQLNELPEGSGDENAGLAAVETLKKIEKTDKPQIILVSTDENITIHTQGLKVLIGEAQAKNAEVVFSLINNKTDAISYIKLSEIPGLAKASNIDINVNGKIIITPMDNQAGSDAVRLLVESKDQLLVSAVQAPKLTQ